MATNSVQYDNYLDAIALGSGFANRASDQAEVRCARFDIELSASPSGTTLNLCVLPAGATFLYAALAYEGTASLTLDIGDAGDSDRLVTAAALGADNPTSTSAFTGFFCRQEVPSTAFGTAGPGGNQSTSIPFGVGYRYTADTVITGTTGGATATAGEVIRGMIFYTVE
jgi:hypothetical protein